MKKIHLVSMPFAPIEWPAVALSLLAAATRSAGLDVTVTYPSLRLADTVGFLVYDMLAAIIRANTLFAEWFFARAAFGDTVQDGDGYIKTLLENDPGLSTFIQRFYENDDETILKMFHDIRAKSEQFLADTVCDILKGNPCIVGVSTSFMQYNSAVALLRCLKKKNPSIVTIIGGANCEAEMGYITKKCFDFVDFVVSGEGDIIFPALCKSVMEYGTELPLNKVPYGVYSKEKIHEIDKSGMDGVLMEVATVPDMNDVPTPDHSDFFTELGKIGFDKRLTPVLLIETSRGCWKGAAKPCTFCGLVGKRMPYRFKKPERVLKELEWLSRKHKNNTFITVDTNINPRYFKTLFKTLGDMNKPYKLYMETHPNLTEEQVQILSDAGICWLQAGIESLHDECLRLLNKGFFAIRSIAFLKYAFEKGIKVSWNILCNIPGDKDDYYVELAELIPLLYHLEPPALLNIRFDRFSQYHARQDDFGLILKAAPAYKYIVPFKGDDLERFAYILEDKKNGNRNNIPEPGYTKMTEKINEWRNLFYKRRIRPKLVMSSKGDHAHIKDTRPCAAAPEHLLEDSETRIINACRAPVRINDIERTSGMSPAGVNKALNKLMDNKLLIMIRERYLALPTYKPERELTIGFEVNRELIKIMTDPFVRKEDPVMNWLSDTKI